MVWGCFSSSGVGPLTKIEGKRSGEMYKHILENNLNGGYGENLSPGCTVYHLAEDDPKHKSRVVKLWLDENEINALERPPKSPDLNPIENLWVIIK